MPTKEESLNALNILKEQHDYLSFNMKSNYPFSIEMLSKVQNCFEGLISEHFDNSLSTGLQNESTNSTQSKWIPCSERLPKEKDGIILICEENGKVGTGVYSEYSDTWYKGDMYGVGGSKVIAWKPLPEPYEGETK